MGRGKSRGDGPEQAWRSNRISNNDRGKMTDSSPKRITNQHLALLHIESVPDDVWDQFCREIETEGLKFLRHQRSATGPQASIEAWMWPAIAVFIAKPYFDAFLKEAGRRHYGVLEDGLSRMWKRLFSRTDGVRFAVLRSDGEVKTEFSPAIAIYGEVRKGQLLKLVFENGCSEHDYRMAIQMFLRLLDSYHCGAVSGDAVIDLDREEGRWGQIVVALDRETDTLRVVGVPGQARRERTKGQAPAEPDSRE